MRYAQFENPIAAGVLAPGVDVAVKVLNQQTGALMPLTSTVATEAPGMPGVYQFALANIDTVAVPVDGFTQIIVEFTETISGNKDYAKLIVRGYVDEVRRIKSLVGALL